MRDTGKASLRQKLRRRRDALSNAHPQAGQDLANRFPLKLVDRFGPVVAVYSPIGSEIDTRGVIQKLSQYGAQLALPRIAGDDMTFHAWVEGTELIRGRFGLAEPHGDAPEVQPGLILAPLLGFDAEGTRLGYGKGYYDRALAKLRENGHAFICGLAFADQECIRLPKEPHDIPLDWVVTEAGSIPLFLARAKP